MKDMSEEKKKEIRDQDVDNMYGENGEHLVPSSEMNEQMYLVVRSIMHHNQRQDYVLKKNDVIKLGRVKFKVRAVNLKSLNKEK